MASVTQPRRGLARISAASFAAALALVTAVVCSTQCARAPVSHVDVYDAFETRELSQIWETDKFVRGAVTMQSEVVRAGRGAAKVVVHSRDKFEAGTNGDADSERAELTEAEKLVPRKTTHMSIPSACLSRPIFPSCRHGW
jgi:hypothetical protein